MLVVRNYPTHILIVDLISLILFYFLFLRKTQSSTIKQRYLISSTTLYYYFYVISFYMNCFIFALHNNFRHITKADPNSYMCAKSTDWIKTSTHLHYIYFFPCSISFLQNKTKYQSKNVLGSEKNLREGFYFLNAQTINIYVYILA